MLDSLLQLFNIDEVVFGPSQGQPFRVLVESVPVPVDHVNPWVAFKLLPMANHEVPIQGVKRA